VEKDARSNSTGEAGDTISPVQPSAARLPAETKLGPLREFIADHFDVDDIGTLAFDIGIKPDEVAGNKASVKARNLIEQTRNRGYLLDLIDTVFNNRPRLTEKLGEVLLDCGLEGMLTTHLQEETRKQIRSVAPPDGMVAIFFSDIAGYSRLAKEEGDKTAFKVLESHNEIVRTRVSEYGGIEVKNWGDLFMVAFGSAKRAVSCAVSTKRNLHANCFLPSGDPVKVRIGIHVGEPLLEKNDYFGNAVNMAARIMSRAEPSQILVSSAVLELVKDVPGLSLSRVGRRKLKNIGSDILWKVDWT